MVDREGGREGGRERRREGEKEGEKEGGREGEEREGGSPCVPVSNKDEGFFKNLIQTFVLFVRVLLQGMSQLLGGERGE